MGPFGSNLYAMPKPPQGQDEESLNAEPTPPPADTPNPPYARYEDSGAESFAPLPVVDASFAPSTEMPEPAVVVGPPMLTLPLIAGALFLLWVFTRNE